MVIGVGEGPAAADRHEPRVLNLWKDHGGTSICDGATRPGQCVASECSTRAQMTSSYHTQIKEGGVERVRVRVREMEDEIPRPRMESEFLKTAAAFFARTQ